DTGTDMAEALRQVLRETAPDSTRVAPEARVTTVVTPRAPREDSAGRRPHPPLDPTLLKTLEEKLRDYVGPVARVLVQTGAARGRSAADLVAEVSLSVPDQADRERFLRETASLIRIRPPAPPAGGPPLS